MMNINCNFALVSHLARIRLDSSVRSLVRLELLPGEKALLALLALVVAHLEVLPLPVVDEGGGRAERVSALGAEVSLDAGVRDHVDLSLLLPRKRL